VAHDFNNLLGAIVARAESAQSELTPSSPATDDVDQIRVTALRAAEIVSQLMTFARQENAPSSAIDLSSLVAEILDLLKFSIAKTAILQTDLAAHMPLLHANAAEIRQVVMNLIINASEALDGKPGTITITTAAGSLPGTSRAAVLLEVRDTGCGMTDDTQARIFDPFFTTHFMGRGLGLSAVQGIVRRHGGSIEVESTPGKGSRFTVALPCAPGPAAAPSPPAESAGSSPKRGGRVLFIEDEDPLRSVIARMLRKKNFEVIEAADGTVGIEMLNSSPGVDVVLLDVTLPGVSGRELFDELHRIQPGAKIILSTAYSRETAMSEFAGRDIWGFIRKPYRTEELVALLQQAAGS
jgi:two-component system, cell cycle sensor histidine kinase and response regulator CckA